MASLCNLNNQMVNPHQISLKSPVLIFLDHHTTTINGSKIFAAARSPPPMLHRCQRATQGPVGDPVKILTAGHHGTLRWRSGNQTWLHDGEKNHGFLQGNFGHVHCHVWLPSKCKWNRWSWASKLRTHCGPHWQHNFELLNRRKCRKLQDSIWKPEHMKPLLSNPTATGFNFETSWYSPPFWTLWKTWVPWVPTLVPTPSHHFAQVPKMIS